MGSAPAKTDAPAGQGAAGPSDAPGPPALAGARSLQLAVIFLLLLALVAVCRVARPRLAHGRGREPEQLQSGPGPGQDKPEKREPSRPAERHLPSEPAGGTLPERQSVHDAERRLYSTADVDRLMAGPLNAWWREDGRWAVYGQRTSHGDTHGLTEFSSSGLPGEVGVDVGPIGLAEYGGRSDGYDDGIPEAWRLPSTPIRWYRPRGQDYFGHDGATPYAEGMFSLTEPDHEPLMN